MLDRNRDEMCRKDIAKAFDELTSQATQSGWPAHEAALVLYELAEAYLMQAGATIIIEGSMQSQFISDRLKG
ncbi:hypothetical protein A6U87_05195 [Rhizobium sp. AC44/96]|uniref:hypothetical protein n=1 Tax=unclassified Rhizobium TaxID=2613769 RepID=UPI00081001EA|nr:MULTISPECIES: hypothetical protein [unclassified Rhizobium]MDM9619823.1 hypothetical protein [Rhizobium sp. S96]OCJ18290.1 hypothetical protein A6U87_05195 [Rhizobium sp. AC44/96]